LIACVKNAGLAEGRQNYALFCGRIKGQEAFDDLRMIDNQMDEIELILTVAGKKISKNVEAADFLEWFRTSVPDIAPDFYRAAESADGGSGAILYLFGRSLWNAMPQPSNRYRPKPLPKPASNGRCPCGSGTKYKQCCATAPTVPPIFESVNLLRFVLDGVSQSVLKNIEGRYIDAEALADVAEQWKADGQYHRSLLLLEPIFDDGKKLPKHAGYLFEVMLDCWPIGVKPKRRLQTCMRLSQHANADVASAALQGAIGILAHEGKIDEAWVLFHQGMRAYPEDVNFAGLELVLLMSSNRFEDPKRRAEFWIHRLKRFGSEYDDYAKRLSAMVESREDNGHLEKAREQSAVVDVLASIIESEAIQYDAYSPLPEDVNDPFVLMPIGELAGIERRWAESVGSSKPQLIELNSYEEPISLVDFISALENEPACLNSLDVLDDMTQSMLVLSDLMPELKPLVTLLLQRAETLFYGLLTNTKPEVGVTTKHWEEILPSLDREVPWLFMENRPMLRMMVRHIVDYREKFASNSVNWLPRAQAVLLVNPNDNHGLRGWVSGELLRLKRPAEALQVLDRYPDDSMGETLMNRTLALYMLNRVEGALDALLSGGSRLREMRRGITLKRYPRPRDFDLDHVIMGGRSESWLYRDEMRDCWEEVGAIDWLKKQLNPRETSRKEEKTATKDVNWEPMNAAEMELDQTDFALDLDMHPLPASTIRNYLKQINPHGAWLLGITLSAALTPGTGLAIQRLINPIVNRVLSEDDFGDETDDSDELYENHPANELFSIFIPLYNHFIARIEETNARDFIAMSDNDERYLDTRLQWVKDDISLVSLGKAENRMELVAGIVAGIDGNPRGWSPMPATARNRLFGPLRLMVATQKEMAEPAGAALDNVSFLDSANGAFELDKQACLQQIAELVSLALISRKN